MVRTQIQLEEGQAAELKQLAARQGVSMAEIIREAVDERLRKDGLAERWQRSLAAIGKHRSGRSDISERHDDYLAEVFEEDLRRGRSGDLR